tara:strand:+ start:186 stop:563 length:378 start_codon:yes stop_codon:yes gene_type:complete
MFLKIKLRTLLLQSFQGTRFGTNPYSLHPLSNYIYYDALNAWMPVLKKMKKEGASNLEMVEMFVRLATEGVCPQKYYEAASSGNSYNYEDLIDESLVNLLNDYCQGDEGLKSMMYGCVSRLRYGL